MDTKEDSQVYHVPHVSPTGEGRDLVSTLERRLVMNIVKGHRSPNLQLFFHSSTHSYHMFSWQARELEIHSVGIIR